MELTASVILLTLTFFTFANALFETKAMRIDRFLGVCPGYKNATIQLFDIHMKSDKKDFTMGLKIRILKDTTSDLKLKMTFEKCKSKEALDSCESSPDVNFSQICAVVNTKLPPFKASLELIQPKMVCPFKKGVYEMANITPDQTTLSMFPVVGWYLRGYIYLLEKTEGDYKTIFCSYLEGTMVVVK